MRARLTVYVVLVFVSGSLLPLAVLPFSPDDRPWLPLFVASYTWGIAVFARALLLSSRPHLTAARWDRRTRWWRPLSAVVVVVATTATAVGVYLALGPPAGIAVAAVLVVVLGLVAWALDHAARRTARLDPIDAEQPDDDRLAPAALRRTLSRRTTWSAAAAAAATVVAVVVAVLLDASPGWIVAAAAGALSWTFVIVLDVSVVKLQWAAGRRLSAYAPDDPDAVKAARKAVLRGRTDRLDEDLQQMATGWAQRAEPALLLQVVTQGCLVVIIGVPPALRVADDPSVGLDLWFLGFIALWAGLGLPWMTRQYHRARDVAHR